MRVVRAKARELDDQAAFAALIALARLLARQAAREWAESAQGDDLPQHYPVGAEARA